MKYRIAFWMTMISCLVFLNGCEKENEPEEIPEGAFRLTGEGFRTHGKTSVEGTSVYWNTGDKVKLNGTEYSVSVSGSGETYVTDEVDNGSDIYGYFPSSLEVTENAGTNTPTLIIPATYRSSFSGDRQKIDLPMIGKAGVGAKGISFKHLTAAVKVCVKNTTGNDVFLDSIIVSSENYQLSGSVELNLLAEDLGLAPNNSGVAAADKRVKVSFANGAVSIRNGGSDIKEVQVPILPVSESDITIKVYTHKLVARTGMPSVNYDYDFSHCASSPALPRNVMLMAGTEIGGAHTVEVDHSLFTVGVGRKVRFSKGNLVCSRPNTSASWSSSSLTWSFMNNQYDIVEVSNSDLGDDFAHVADIRHFGWGTSGWNNGNTCYRPYNTNASSGDYYGPYKKSQYWSLVGDYKNADWGVYNAISNGGNMDGMWRTLSGGENGEMDSLFNHRAASTLGGAVARYTKAKVGTTYGVIIFPDSYAHPEDVSVPIGIGETGGAGWNGNSYSIADWTKMEEAGAVFLAAAGYRSGNYMSNNTNVQGYYWTTTLSNDYNAYIVQFSETIMNASSYNSTKARGCSVRLVQDL